MNKRYMILCVDDEREVLDSILQDLEDFEDHFDIEAAQSVAEANAVIDDALNEECELALVLCDHIMPERNGIDFLIELATRQNTQYCRKILVTGQAGLEDTVEAVNHASLDFYVSKPWSGDELRKVVRTQLTQYMIKHSDSLLEWTKILDTETILSAMSDRRSSFGE